MAVKIFFIASTLFAVIRLAATEPSAYDVRIKCQEKPTYLPPTAIETGPRLEELRKQMAANDLAAYIVPSEDAHQSEYIADRDKRREYISGFSGSAGLAIVTTTDAALWTDARYQFQADMELDCNWILMYSGSSREQGDWIVRVLMAGEKVGFDPTVMSISSYNTYSETFEAVEGGGPVLISLTTNLVDAIWEADSVNPKPSYPDVPLITIDAAKYTGETWQQKIWEYTSSIRSQLNDHSADALVVSKLDEVAWLFNLRGKDIPYNPMFVSYSIITLESITLYMYDKTGRLNSDVKKHLGIGKAPCTDEDTVRADCVTVKDYDEFLTDLDGLTSTKTWISDQMSYAIYERVPEAERFLMASPVLLMKAIKSPKEIKGMNNAHLKDSVSLCRLGAWMQHTMDGLKNPRVGDINVMSELIVEDKAYEFRSQMEGFSGLSFRAISGFGPNGAIMHYSSSEETNVAITTKSTFVFDSGSQYYDGTVDITRTFHFGKPTNFMKEAYTRVLIGHIDLAMSTFTPGVSGRDLDSLAREPLWRGGLDYRHGTGHGIGHFLNVHESPISINSRSDIRIELGVFNANEPGYYAEGAFGIRIENVMYTVKAKTRHSFYGRSYMTWRMSSLVPLEPILIDFTLFSPRELDWYNMYNKRVRNEVGPMLKKMKYNDAYDWMWNKTEEVTYSFTLSASSVQSTSILVIVCTALIWFLFH